MIKKFINLFKKHSSIHVINNNEKLDNNIIIKYNYINNNKINNHIIIGINNMDDNINNAKIKVVRNNNVI